MWHDRIASALALRGLQDHTTKIILICVAMGAWSVYGMRCDISTAIELISLESADF